MPTQPLLRAFLSQTVHIADLPASAGRHEGLPSRGRLRAAKPAWLYALAAALSGAGAQAQCVQQWSGDFGIPPGMNGSVYAMTHWDQDGPGPVLPQLVACGAFTSGSGVPTYRIARWDGVTWHRFANGIGTNTAVAMYAMTNWDPDGPGPQDPQLIGAGRFAIGANNVVGNYIIRWDVPAGAWQPLSTGMNNDVRCLTVWDPDGAGPFPPQLIAGGDFTIAGGVTVNRIARWDGANWQPLLSGMNNIVTALTTWDPDGPGPLPDVLVASGSFTTAGGTPAVRIARFDGLAWQPFGTGLNNAAWVFGTWDSGNGPEMIAGGDFTLANGVSVARVARFDGTTWHPFGSGMNSTVRAFTTWDPDGPGPTPPRLVATGTFTTAGGNPIPRIAQWDGANWSGLGAGVNGSAVYAATTFDPDGSGPDGPQLVVGGDFSLAAGAIANNIATWVSSPTPVVITSPAPVRSCPGNQVSFSVRAAAGAFPTYRWRKNGVDLTDGPTGNGSAITGATSITLNISNVALADAGDYDVVVTNGCGSGVSAPAALSFCYANCDCSTATPVLNVNDFVCFQQRFAAGDPYANCDGSTAAPVLNVNDFVCFQQRFAAGCP